MSERRKRKTGKGVKCHERPEHPVRFSAPPRPRRPLTVERPLATLEEAVVRIKTRRICCRIPWGFPELCPAFIRKTPEESNTNPRGIGHKARDNPTIWNFELTRGKIVRYSEHLKFTFTPPDLNFSMLNLRLPIPIQANRKKKAICMPKSA